MPRSARRGEDALGDVVDLAESVDLDEQRRGRGTSATSGCGLALVDLLAVADRLLGVVRSALLERALAKPAHDLVAVGHQPDDGIQGLTVGAASSASRCCTWSGVRG